MNRIDKEYQDLLCYILGNGVEKKDRTGTGTLSVFGWQIRHDMKEGFPLLTTKKMAWKSIVTELLWFLRGDTNIKYLIDNGCHIWDGDAYKKYCNAHPDAEKSFQYEGSTIETRRMTKEEFIHMIKTDFEFSQKWGEIGPIYGAQWRHWNVLNWTATEIEDPMVKGIINLSPNLIFADFGLLVKYLLSKTDIVCCLLLNAKGIQLYALTFPDAIFSVVMPE